MAKPKTAYICSACEWESPKWVGQCRMCHEWGTLEEAIISPPPSGGTAALRSGLSRPSPAVEVEAINSEQAGSVPTGVAELDRVLGGGIVPGSVILLAGEPGVGKSTLLLDVAARFAHRAQVRGVGPVLYVSGEESAAQVHRRATRIGALAPGLLLAAETEVANVLWHAEQESPSLLVVDSVQTLSSGLIDGSAGSVSQVKTVAGMLIQHAKQTHTPVLLVGHVTKEGNIAGPRTLEHLVDVVCHFEGDRTTALRMLRAVKNRYGATDEVGCFVLVDDGIEEVPDPSILFTSGTRGEAPGSSVTVMMEGHRPLLTEIQALVAPGSGGSPRRATSGVDSSRVAMILAVLAAHLKLDLSTQEVYVSTVGGARAAEPSTDLAIATSICSAAWRRSPLPGTILIGEVGLTGEIRGCSGLSRRLLEAARLGWKRALVPASQVADLKLPKNLDVVPVDNVKDALRHVLN